MQKILLLICESREQRKLTDLVEFYKGNGLSWNDINEEGSYPCILYGNLYTDYGMITESVKYKTSNVNWCLSSRQ